MNSGLEETTRSPTVSAGGAICLWVSICDHLCEPIAEYLVVINFHLLFSIIHLKMYSDYLSVFKNGEREDGKSEDANIKISPLPPLL